ncbi:MAG: AfsA-related hotdog domain-containing protein [Thermoanaerobaculia bacterium]
MHRNYIDHVLITDVARLDDDYFLCAGRLPQLHGYFNEVRQTPCCNVFSASEIARQASLAISHRYLEIPEGFAQIMHSARGRMEDAWDDRTVAPRSPEFLLEVRLIDRRYRKTGELIGVNADYTGYSDFSKVYRSHGEWTLVPKKLYQRLRHQASDSISQDQAEAMRSQAIEPSSVGRKTTENVFISNPTAESHGYSTYLITDSAHPYFFEHEIDHVPGMLLLEGCYQFAVAVSGAVDVRSPEDLTLQRYTMCFHRFAGLGAPVRLAAIPGSLERISNGNEVRVFEITASQDEVTIAEFQLVLGIKPTVTQSPAASERR